MLSNFGFTLSTKIVSIKELKSDSATRHGSEKGLVAPSNCRKRSQRRLISASETSPPASGFWRILSPESFGDTVFGLRFCNRGLNHTVAQCPRKHIYP